MSRELTEQFKRLGKGSVHAVQDGNKLNSLDEYLHVIRPIEGEIKAKMGAIQQQGGGLVLLVGSAGDGKSHLISCLKEAHRYDDFFFYNDATISFSPKMDAIDTLLQALDSYSDANIASTNMKMLLAINLGKLNELIDTPAFKEKFTQLITVVSPIFTEEGISDVHEIDRVKVVQFNTHQIYELLKDSTDQYPVASEFLTLILKKITAKEDGNPFYHAYNIQKGQQNGKIDPIVLNYELLSVPEIQHTIVNLIIEAIIRFKLIVTPRDYLDFISRIVVPVDYDEEHYSENASFFESLLPSLVYCGTTNNISKSLLALDPLKTSNNDHDKTLSYLSTTDTFPVNFIPEDLIAKLPSEIQTVTEGFYGNNGKDTERIAKFLFRLKHLLKYHSEDPFYAEYLRCLCGSIRHDPKLLNEFYGLVNDTIVRHCGSYYSQHDLVPLNIQGSNYRLFAQVFKKGQEPTIHYIDKNEFYPYITLQWKIDNTIIPLNMDYDLFCYLNELKGGMLAVNYESDTNFSFSRFIQELVDKSDCDEKVVILDSDNKPLNLQDQFGTITF